MDVTEQDYELLSQYLDRELAATDLRQLELRLAVEPDLQACLQRMQAINKQLQQAASNVSAEPLPARLVALLQPQPQRIIALPHKRMGSWGFALAASLVVAASATLIGQWDQQSASVGVDSALALALEQSPSRGNDWEVLQDGRRVRPVLSFQDNAGSWCREYLVSDNTGDWHGVACRSSGGGWENTVLAATELVIGPGDYRPAGALDNADVATFIDLNAAGIPLDADQEAALIATHWQ